MRRESILMIWVGGLVLAAVVYGVGTDRFLAVCVDAIASLDAAFRHLVFTLGVQATGVVRALTVALYAVFAVLALLASRGGRHGIGALIVVSLVLMILLWRPYADDPAPLGRWILALALNFSAAVVMTQRLMAPLHRDRPWPPQFPPGRPL